MTKVSAVPLNAKTIGDLLPVISRLLEELQRLNARVSTVEQSKGTQTIQINTTESTIVGGNSPPLTIVISEGQPSEAFDGLRWYNPAEPAIYIFYGDGSSGQWVQEPGGWPIA